MNDNDNVTPIRPDVPNLSEFRRSDRPYTGPADSVKEVLSEHGFDKEVIGAGWVELRVVANFTEVGAMFHTVQARRVNLTVPDRPAFILLGMVALAEGLEQKHYVEKATIDEMDKLNTLLDKANVEQIAALAVPIPGVSAEQILVGIDREAVAQILLAVTERA